MVPMVDVPPGGMSVGEAMQIVLSGAEGLGAQLTLVGVLAVTIAVVIFGIRYSWRLFRDLL